MNNFSESFVNYVVIFFIGFVMNYLFRKFQNFSVTLYDNKIYKEDYLIIPTDAIFFLISFFYYNDLLNILFLYLGFITNSFVRKYFLGVKSINFRNFLFASLSFFLPLTFFTMVLKFFLVSYYQYYIFIIAFVFYLFFNKFLAMFFLGFTKQRNYGKVIDIFKKSLRVGFTDGFIFSQFIFTYISFLFLIEGKFFYFAFLILTQFLFLRFLYFSNILVDSYQNLIDTLLNFLQFYDVDTYEHSNRVAFIAKIISESMNLTKEEIDSIFLAAKLHDIGKIDIPSYILNKPSKLTKLEFKIITLHPLVAVDIVKNISSQRESDFIKYHHFYPTVFNKPVTYEDIPIGARIIMVADIYDAIRSKRKYKESFSHQQAIEEIGKMLQDRLIDPQIFEVLKSNYEKYKDVYGGDSKCA